MLLFLSFVGHNTKPHHSTHRSTGPFSFALLFWRYILPVCISSSAYFSSVILANLNVSAHQHGKNDIQKEQKSAPQLWLFRPAPLVANLLFSALQTGHLMM